jgi:hypothetical protein
VQQRDVVRPERAPPGARRRQRLDPALGQEPAPPVVVARRHRQRLLQRPEEPVAGPAVGGAAEPRRARVVRHREPAAEVLRGTPGGRHLGEPVEVQVVGADVPHADDRRPAAHPQPAQARRLAREEPRRRARALLAVGARAAHPARPSSP